MAVKYKNPPVIYAVAKLIYSEAIGSYGDDKYKLLRDSLKGLSFDSYTLSKVNGIQLKQADNKFSINPANTERVGYFSPNRKTCALIDENSIELRLAEYTSHSQFLDTFIEFLSLCRKHEIAMGNNIHEIELHYVDLFVPVGENELQSMFANLKLPNEQFFSESSDLFKVGSLQFTRILQSGRERVSLGLEQLRVMPDARARKMLPDVLMEPDNKLAMPLDTGRLFNDTTSGDYAIVHTCSAALVDETVDLRSKFEELYSESRKTFEHMICSENCDIAWQPI